MYEIQKRESLSIRKWFRQKDELWFNPPYQRNSDIWTVQKKKLLIDSILNDFDLPKFYVHDQMFGKIKKKNISNDSKKRFAIIDGKQRFSIIFSFINDEFSLSDDFDFQKNPQLSSKLAGKKYSQIKKQYPEIAEDFNSFTLDVVYILTDEKEKIEELFLRLNEGSPVNSQEKRLAKSPKYAALTQRILKESKFKDLVKFNDNRKGHSEVVTKLLYIEHSDAVVDVKKIYLDQFVEKIKKSNSTFDKPANEVISVLKKLKISLKSHKISSRGILPVYYLFYKKIKEHDYFEDHILREFIIDFEKKIKAAKKDIKEDIFNLKSDSQIIEFNRLNQQGTNDAGSILGRLNILTYYYDVWFKKNYTV